MKITIVGAGAAGLMAARELTKAGAEVLMIEASRRIGGRVHTLVPDGLTQPVEAAAEFIHGALPVTLSLMKKAGLDTIPAEGAMFRAESGTLTEGFGSGNGWEAFYEKLAGLKRDCTLTQFLDLHFPVEKFADLRKEVTEMAQGLDLADPDRLSTMSIQEEWLSDAPQFRPATGYRPLVDFLFAEVSKGNFRLLTGKTVTHVTQTESGVEVFCGSEKFRSDVVLLTVPIGVYQQRKISFSPEIPEVFSQFDKIGFGQVIKILLEFDSLFWEVIEPDLGFLFSPDGFTFWTQLSASKPLLTGWIGNDYAPDIDQLSDGEIIGRAIGHLSDAFRDSDVTNRLRASAVFRYTSDSAEGGAYSWLTPESKKAIRTLNKGVNGKLFFAGEALHPKGEVATVEAALHSGQYAARKIRKLPGFENLT